MPPKFSLESEIPLVYSDKYPEYQQRTSPCEFDCPAGNQMQRAMTLIKSNRFEEAFETIKCTNPFPGITGRACLGPCMDRCNRGNYDEVLRVRSLERAAADHTRPDKEKKPIKLGRSGKKIAIIGAGPAGMSCAYFSVLLGHDVVVFETLPVLGGMTRIVPDYRLPKEVIDREMGAVVDLGMEVRTNTKVGKDISLEEIVKKYDACFISTGAWHGKTLNIPGANLAMTALSFLREVNLGKKPAIGKRVMIIGGGSVAVDCACTARRLGAEEVHMACLETKDSMLATKEDITQAVNEGIVFHNSHAPHRIVGKNGRIAGVECLDVQSFEFDDVGGAKINSIAGSEHVLPADTVIFAIGEAPELGFMQGSEKLGLNITRRGTLEVDPTTLATNRDGIFAGGDVVNGPDCIARSVGNGRKAAISVDFYLYGKRPEKRIRRVFIDAKGNVIVERGLAPDKRELPQHLVLFDDLWHLDYFEKAPQVVAKRLAFPESVKSFEELGSGYSKEEAISEASRCFHCGHCFQCGLCVEDCLLDVLEMDTVKNLPFVAYPEECWHCADCKISCPTSSITIKFPLSMLI